MTAAAPSADRTAATATTAEEWPGVSPRYSRPPLGDAARAHLGPLARALAAGLLALATGVGTPAHAQDRDHPDTERASFTLAAGFEANLFASEADGVIKPIQMRFDARGRLWVTGSSVYPQIEPGQEPDDKVLILEDTDGDGRSDVTTVFADGLFIPTGLETLADGTGCYLGHGTELLLLRDTDGDGRADHREVVLRGFGTGDNHQNINSFTWAPGGELWFCQGLHAYGRVETPFGIVRLDQAGIWRLNPRTLRLEGFYGSAADPQNPWGFVFTDWGEALELAGNNSVVIFPAPGMVKRPKPAQPANLWPTGRGRKMSGGEIVGTSHFPDHWQGRLIVGGYLNNGVWTMTVHDHGSGFRLEDAEPLVTSSHSSFRPVDVKFGPDGALYICDWYNPIIGHYQTSFRHPDRDRSHGRIWRVTATGRPLTPKPALATATAAELARALASPDRWTRRFASRLLAEKPRREVIAALAQPPTTTTTDTTTRPDTTRREIAAKERLDVLRNHEALTWQDIDETLKAANPALRAQAARALQFVTSPFPPDQVAAALRTLAADPAPRVRLHAVIATSFLDTPEAVEIALIATDQPTDGFLDFALDQAVASLKPHWLPVLRDGRLSFDGHPDRLARLVRADGTPDTLDALRALWRSPTLDDASREAFLGILAEAGAPDDLATILALDDEALKARLLPGVTRAAQLRGVVPPGDLAALARALLDSRSPAVQNEALRLAGAWNLAPLKPVLLERASSSPGALAGLLALDPAAAAQLAAARLATDDGASQTTFFLPPFFQRAGGADALAHALQSTPPSPASAAAAQRTLSERGLAHPGITATLTQAAGPPATTWSWSASFADTLAAEARTRGNPARGRDIYLRPELTCTACHSLNDQGGRLGPALDAVGAAQPIDFLVGAVLAPQKEIKEGYEAIEATTRTGDIIVGYRAPGPPHHLNLRDPASTTIRSLPHPSLTGEKSLGSLMPAGLLDSLSRDELIDLFSFLGSLGKSPAPTR